MTLPGSRGRASFRKILFATDFSPHSETALRYGIGLSRRFDAILYTVSVASAEITYDVQPPDPLSLRHSAETKMAKLADSELLQGIKHIEVVKDGFGMVSQVLLELIERLHIDLVVLGMHGRGGIKQLVLGSVAEELVNRAPCAVLTVGPQVPAKTDLGLPLRTILCATDLGPASAKVLAYALWLVKAEQSRLILLHVLKMPADAPSEQQAAAKDTAVKQLMQLLPPETSACAVVQPIVDRGVPGERILKVAEDQGADLIVIGPRHTLHPRVAAHLPWAMLHQVLCHARCPVLRCATDVI